MALAFVLAFSLWFVITPMEVKASELEEVSGLYEITVNYDNLINGYAVFGLYPDGSEEPYYFSDEDEGPAILQNATDDVRLFIYPDTGYTLFGKEPAITAGNANYNSIGYDMEENCHCCIIDGFTETTEITITCEAREIDYIEFEKNAQIEAEAPIKEVKINNADGKLMEEFFTEQEQYDIKYNFLQAQVFLKVSKIDAVDEREKTAIEAAAAGLSANVNITYFDVGLCKQTGSDTPVEITESGIPISITIKIPNELLINDTNITREYKILRYHAGEGVSEVEGSFDAATSEFTFETKKFSTYAIVYKDVAVSNPGGVNPGGGNPDSGNSGGGNTSGNTGSNPSSSSGTSESSTITTTTTDISTTVTVEQQQLEKDSVPKTGEGTDYTVMVWTVILAIGVIGLLVEKQKRIQ